ncbi:MAG: GNAT family N-acetyltransferase [Bacteroidetes bacterium]|nr:GNAT family N-acetyltransferase [Bacteroidota bacterium]MCB9043160.1 GNAT family N-acetyltransferase [Chitinophagales bacterium]
MNIRKAVREDVPAALRLIKELAAYEKAADAVSNTEAMMVADGFGEKPVFVMWVAETGEQQIVGIALCYAAYSTWKGKMLYLDDLVVQEKWRGNSIGKKLMDEVFAYAKAENCKLVKWQVLDWNEPAINFYKKLSLPLTFDGEWIDVKLYGKDYG